MKRAFKYIIILVVIGLIVVGGVKAIKNRKAEEAKTPVAVPYSMVVKTMTPKIKNNLLTLPYLALTKSNDDVKISSRVSARIKYIVKSGKSVKKGETIVRIDDKEFKTQLQALNLSIRSLKSQLSAKKVALANLLKTHERTIKLLKVRGASKEEFDKEVTNIEALKSAIAALKFKMQELNANKSSVNNMLTYTTIKAPVDGIATRLANVGDVALMGKPLVDIGAKSNSYLIVRLPSDVNANAIIYHKKSYPLSALNTTYDGLLEYLANINESLASNQTISIDVVIYKGFGYKLPHDAILNRNGKSFVLNIRKDHAVPKEVKIIANGEQGVVVVGVNQTEKIVVAKQDILLKLLSGIKVRTVK